MYMHREIMEFLDHQLFLIGEERSSLKGLKMSMGRLGYCKFCKMGMIHNNRNGGLCGSCIKARKVPIVEKTTLMKGNKKSGFRILQQILLDEGLESCPHCHSTVGRKNMFKVWEKQICLNDECHKRQKENWIQEMEWLAYSLDPYDPESWKSKYNEKGEFKHTDENGMPQFPLLRVIRGWSI